MSEQVNVVIFMTDQQRGVTVDGRHRNRARTPNVDALAAEGTVFGRVYSPSPHCCPARASFFTGRYPSEHGVWNNVDVPNALSRGPRQGTPFWSHDLVRAGYRLGFSGKWHVDRRHGPAAHGWTELGSARPDLPDSISDDRLASVARSTQLQGLRDRTSSADGARGGGEIARPGWPAWSLYGTADNPFGDHQVVDRAVDFIAGSAETDRPFALFVGTLGPHDPYVPPQEFLDLYAPDDIELPQSFSDEMNDKPAMYRRARDRFDQLTEAEHREALRHYLAFCSYEDHLFGPVLQALRDSGRYDDTVVIYLSDHGDYAGEHGLWAKGLPSFLPAYHVPLVIKDARRNDSRDQVERCDVPLTHVDLGPTLLDLCGVTPAAAMSGRSMAEALYSPPSDPDRDLVLQSNGNEVYGIQRIVPTDRWKLVVNLFDDDELYDRHADPDEMVNLIAPRRDGRQLGRAPEDILPPERRAVVRDLYDRLWRFGIDHDDEIMNPYILTALATYGPLDVLHADDVTSTGPADAASV